VRNINGQLAPLYTRRNDLLHDYPALQAEFGKPKRPRSGSERAIPSFQSYVAPVSRWETERRAKELKQSIHPLFAYWRSIQRPPLGESTKHWKDDGKRASFEQWLASDEGQTKLREHEIALVPKTEQPIPTSPTASNKHPLVEAAENGLLDQQEFVNFANEYYGRAAEPQELESLKKDKSGVALFHEWRNSFYLCA
jgi:hypothetical protein